MEEQEEKKEPKEVLNPAHKLAAKLRENKEKPNVLFIGRIPWKTKIAFTKLADEEFEGDFGFALKWLMDDILSEDTRTLIAEIALLKERLAIVESLVGSKDEKKELPKDEYRKMADGSLRKKRR